MVLSASFMPSGTKALLTPFAGNKRIKHWPRQWKLNVIEAQNPNWSDMYDTLI